MLSSFLAEVRVAFGRRHECTVPTLIAASCQLKADGTEHVLAIALERDRVGARERDDGLHGDGHPVPRAGDARVLVHIGRGVHEIAAVVGGDGQGAIGFGLGLDEVVPCGKRRRRRQIHPRLRRGKVLEPRVVAVDRPDVGGPGRPRRPLVALRPGLAPVERALGARASLRLVGVDDAQRALVLLVASVDDAAPVGDGGVGDPACHQQGSDDRQSDERGSDQLSLHRCVLSSARELTVAASRRSYGTRARSATRRIASARALEVAEDDLVLANQHRSEVANVVGERGSDPLIERAHFLLVHVRPVALGDEARGMFRHGGNMTRRTARRKT